MDEIIVPVNQERLKEIEWSAFRDDDYVLGDGVSACPACGRDWNPGKVHAPGCWLAPLIGRQTGTYVYTPEEEQ